MRDHGEVNPSDLDDVTPASPLAGMSERNYRVVSEARSIPMPVARPTVNPDPDVPSVPETQRTEFSGIVVKVIGDRQYGVVLQNGKRVLANAVSDVGVTSHFKPGNSVIVTSGQADNTWHIIGDKTETELCILDYAASASPTSTAQIQVPLGQEITNFPIDDTFSHSGKISAGAAGSFRVEEGGTYSVGYTVNIDFTEPDEKKPEPVEIEGACVSVNEKTTVIKTTKIQFDRSVGLVVGEGPDCEGQVSFKVDTEDCLLNSKSTTPVWTQNVKVGGSLQIGSQVGNGWLKIGGPNGYAELGHGGGQVSIRLPELAPSKPGNIPIAVGVKGQFVQLDWVGPGFSNEIEVITGISNFKVNFKDETASFDVCYEKLKFNRGVFMGPGTMPSNRPVDTSRDQGQDYNPC